MKLIPIMGALLCCVGAASGQTAEELVSKNIEAKGGLAAIKAITSVRSSGKLETQGIVIVVGTDQKPGNLIRQTATIQGRLWGSTSPTR